MNAVHVVLLGESHGCTYCDPGDEYEWHTDTHKDVTITVDCEHGFSSPHTVHNGCCSDGWVYEACEHNGYYTEHYYCEHNFDGVEHTYTE